MICYQFQPRVTNRVNADLTREVSKEEIQRTVFSIDSESAPGPDGLTGFF